MLIRQAEERDIEKWQQLANEVADLFNSPDMGNDPGFIKYMESKIYKNEALAAIDRFSDDLIGIIGFSRKYNRISWVAVKKEHRGNGIGTELLSRALDQLDKGNDISVITFSKECKEGTAARKTYKKLGFIEADENFIHDGNRRCKMVKFADNDL